MAATRTPITDDAMIEQCVEHFAEQGVIPESRQKWERYLEDNQSKVGDWGATKIWYRRKLKAARDATDDVGKDGAAFFTSRSKKELEEEAKEEIRKDYNKKVGDSLQNIAAAATAKQEMVDETNLP